MQIKTLLIIAITAPAVVNADVYKCDVNGKTIYQQAPCANGKAVDIQESSGRASLQRQIDAQSTRLNRSELHDMANEIERKNEAAARAQLRMIDAQNRAERAQRIRRDYADQYQRRADELRHEAMRGSAGAYGRSWRNNLADDYENMARQQR